MFSIYLELGIQHILDLKGYDHILFLLALCVSFSIKEWKKLLVLITAFTIGHSLTLALAALDIVSFSPYWIEILIPVTILIASVQNIVRLSDTTQNRLSLYPLVLTFGLIHGLGFSNYFRALLGRASDITIPLLGFNLGVEIAQVFLVVPFLLFTLLLTEYGKIKQQHWILFVSILTACLSAFMIYQRI